MRSAPRCPAGTSCSPSPRLIRNTFKFDRALLDELYHAAHSAITAWLRQRTGRIAEIRITPESHHPDVELPP